MIHRLREWIHRVTGPGGDEDTDRIRSGRTTICDLPAEFGERMRLETVRSLFRDPTKREVVCAMVQLLWLQRVTVVELGKDASRVGKVAEAAGQLCAVDALDGVLSDVQVLMSEKGVVDAEVRGWFRE